MHTASLESMHRYFSAGHTRSCAFRKKQLHLLKGKILSNQEAIDHALYSDLKKGAAESWATETGLVLAEINYLINNLDGLMSVKQAKTNLVNFPSSTRIYHDPLGVVLIIAPWNYPLQLSLLPLAGAIAGGNCVILKPSELAPATSSLIASIIDELFDPQYIRVIEGEGAELIPAMLKSFRFDHIFFTGSKHVGRIIYQEAAAQLIPVTLELGGKSPAIVEADANIPVAARRIVLGKFLNAGQSCIAPDYVLVHASVKQQLESEMIRGIAEFYSSEPQESKDYGRIINLSRFNALEKLMNEGQIVCGGNKDESSLYIAPTIITGINMNAAIMQEEIFGPLLPVLSFETREEAMRIVQLNANPLAFYLFTENENVKEEWIQNIHFGGGCINNTAWHFANHNIPFGGVGSSGIGVYHGKYSFHTFTREKPLLQTPTWIDPKLKYPPFTKKMKWLKFFIR